MHRLAAFILCVALLLLFLPLPALASRRPHSRAFFPPHQYWWSFLAIGKYRRATAFRRHMLVCGYSRIGNDDGKFTTRVFDRRASVVSGRRRLVRADASL